MSRRGGQERREPGPAPKGAGSSAFLFLSRARRAAWTEVAPAQARWLVRRPGMFSSVRLPWIAKPAEPAGLNENGHSNGNGHGNGSGNGNGNGNSNGNG